MFEVPFLWMAPVQQSDGGYRLETKHLPCKAALIDMDGTLTDSLAVVERLWLIWCERYGLNPNDVMPIIHGRPSFESIQILQPELSLEEQQESADFVENLEVEETDGVVPLPGAAEFLAAVEKAGMPHAIVTSATIALMKSRMGAAGLPIPHHTVTVERIEQGKPNPDCYLLGAELVGVDPVDCVVFEDSEAGIRAGLRAGMHVIGVGSDALRVRDLLISEGIDEAGEKFDHVPDLSHIAVDPGAITIRF